METSSTAFFSQGLSSGSSLSITAALLFISTADKKIQNPTSLLEFSENKRAGRGAWNLFRWQGQDYILLVLETEGKGKKVNFKTIIEAKPKPHPQSVISLVKPLWVMFQDWFFLMILTITEFPRQISGFWPADVATPCVDNSSFPFQASLLTDSTDNVHR